MIDNIRIKIKTKENLNKESHHEEYYPLCNESFKKYLELTNLNLLYNDPAINQEIENIINNSVQHTNEYILIKLKSLPQFKNIVNNQLINSSISNNALKKVFKSAKKITINNTFYYKDFILINENIIQNFFDNSKEKNLISCYFGNSRIFIIINVSESYLIQIYTFDNNNIIPEIIFESLDKEEFSFIIYHLKDQGYKHFWECHLLFRNQSNNIDYASPVFDNKNKEIGYAYKYNSSIKDYSEYKINDKFKAILKLYFNYYNLKFSLNEKNKDGNYYLINKEYIKKYKDYYDYENLIKKLDENNFCRETKKLIKNGKENYSDIINDKNLTLIIKSLPQDYNKTFIEKSKNNNININSMEEPNIKFFQNNEIFYYDEFELIDKNLYKLLFNKNKGSIFIKCIFINQYIYIIIPKNLNKNKNKIIIISGSLNEDNIFKAKYLIEYNSEAAFKKSLKYANTIGGFDIYINSIQFKNEKEKLFLENNESVGYIINLDFSILKSNNLNDKNNQEANKNKKIKNYFNKHPLIGLQSIGGVPNYFNATIQFFCQIDLLINYIKYKLPNNLINNNNLSLIKPFKTLIENLWPTDDNNYKDENKKYIHENNNNKYFAPY